MHPLYGGNKARKLTRVLQSLAPSPPRRIVTFGTAGSHHVLATALFAEARAISARAILLPEPHTEHVERTFLAILGQRAITVEPAQTLAHAALSFASGHRRGDLVLGPGGAGLPATLAYVDAAQELAGQVRRGLLPSPDEIVVALGTGTTVAGLLVGLALAGLATRVVAVQVVGGLGSRWLTLRLAARAARAVGVASAGLGMRLCVERGELGSGYGYPTAAGDAATARAASTGLALDPTYTAKAFAHALARASQAPFGRVVLYWHTLSSQPLAALTGSSPRLVDLAPSLRGLLRPVSRRAETER